MNEITDAALIDALRRQMTIAVARQVVAAGNLANLDTPGYRTKEVTFDDVLGKELQQTPPASTNPAHIAVQTATSGGAGSHEVNGLPSRRDGNNVQLDKELLDMSNASSDFAAAQTALTQKFRLIRYAINEGR